MKPFSISMLAVALLALPVGSMSSVTAGEIVIAQQVAPPPPPTPRPPAGGGGGTPTLSRPAVPQQPAPAQQVQVAINNQTQQTIQYFWIDSGGQAQFIATVAPGETVVQSSQPGLELVFAVNGDEVANYFTGNEAQQSYSIDSSTLGDVVATQPGLPAPQPPVAVQPPVTQTPVVQQPTVLPQQPQAPELPATPTQPLTIGSTPTGAANPSFPCTGNLTTTERVLCTDAELAGYDREMVDVYQWLSGELNQFEQAELRNDQRDWLRQRNGCGSSRDCLLAEYLDRIAYLNEYIGPGGDDGVAPVSFPHAAKSWGGQVRSGPGTQYRRLAGLSEGEPIMILEEANAPFYQDRPWFKIRFRGRIGYHWGGIICPLRSAVPGTYQVCN